MYDGLPRDRGETEYRRRKSQSPIIQRPDRIALWAVGMAIVAMVAAAASAHAGSGGTGVNSTGSCSNEGFGSRTLRLGDCGKDVKTLHWIMKADSYGVSLNKNFDDSTQSEVQAFQRRNDLSRNGVVGKRTRKQLVRTMPKSRATWYGMLHSQTACGVTLHRGTIGVAHRNLPCGTKVALKYGHRYVLARVVDRGPYTKGVRWDLTQGAAEALHFTGSDEIRAAPIKR
jgi:rare lipoprotein A (RlpA)-like double-psi beta-barrel protein/putative peptidoglycan binding protein